MRLPTWRCVVTKDVVFNVGPQMTSLQEVFLGNLFWIGLVCLIVGLCLYTMKREG